MKGKTSILVLFSAFFLFSCIGRMKKDLDMGPSQVQAVEQQTAKPQSGFKTLSQYTEEEYSGEKEISAVQISTEVYSAPKSLKEIQAKEEQEDKNWIKRDKSMIILIGGLILAIAVIF